MKPKLDPPPPKGAVITRIWYSRAELLVASSKVRITPTLLAKLQGKESRP